MGVTSRGDSRSYPHEQHVFGCTRKAAPLMYSERCRNRSPRQTRSRAMSANGIKTRCDLSKAGSIRKASPIHLGVHSESMSVSHIPKSDFNSLGQASTLGLQPFTDPDDPHRRIVCQECSTSMSTENHPERSWLNRVSTIGI